MSFKRGLNPKEAMGTGLNAMLNEIKENKIRCVKEQNFTEACEWRDKEVEFMKTHFGIDISKKDDPEMYKEVEFKPDFLNSLIITKINSKQNGKI